MCEQCDNVEREVLEQIIQLAQEALDHDFKMVALDETDEPELHELYNRLSDEDKLAGNMEVAMAGIASRAALLASRYSGKPPMIQMGEWAGELLIAVREKIAASLAKRRDDARFN